MINIGLCTDENYAMPCGVCITSIFENNMSSEVVVTLLTNGLSIKTKRKLQKTANRYNQKIKIIEINDDLFNTYPITEQFPKSIYYRLLFPDLLKDCEKLLYIDVDTIVINSLQPLYDINISDFLCGVIIDSACDDIRQKNRILIHGDYFNSGVLLMNLHEWRKQKIACKCLEYLKVYPNNCIYPDQDALNAVMDNSVLYLPLEYNLQEGFLFEKKDLLLNKTRWDQIEPSVEKTVIIHFSGILKPWHRECTHPFNDIFEKYKTISLWSSISKFYRYNNGITSKIKNLLARIGIRMKIKYERKYNQPLCAKLFDR